MPVIGCLITAPEGFAIQLSAFRKAFGVIGLFLSTEKQRRFAAELPTGGVPKSPPFRSGSAHAVGRQGFQFIDRRSGARSRRHTGAAINGPTTNDSCS